MLEKWCFLSPIITSHSPLPSKNAVSTESVILLIRFSSVSKEIILSTIRYVFFGSTFCSFSIRLFIFSIFSSESTLEYPCCRRVLSFSVLASSNFVSNNDEVSLLWLLIKSTTSEIWCLFTTFPEIGEYVIPIRANNSFR